MTWNIPKAGPPKKMESVILKTELAVYLQLPIISMASLLMENIMISIHNDAFASQAFSNVAIWY